VPGVAAKPIDLDIADGHDLDVRRLAAQAQAECLADRAAAAVAADQVSRLNLSFADRGGHAVGVLAEAAQLGAQFNSDAEVGEPFAQDLLHPPLGDHQAGRVWDVGRGRPSGLGVDLSDHLRSLVLAMRHVGDPGGQHSVDHREVVEHFQAAWAQSLTAGTARELLRPIDDAHRDATPGKITRERQAGRAGTSHEDICLGHALIKTLLG
jgi:hypothetical protein